MNTKEIERLAGEAYDTARTYQALGYRNAWGLSVEDGRRQAIEYALAAAKSREARKALDDYLDGIRGLPRE